MRELRPHQAKAIDKLREALRSGSKRPMLMAPTGAGKTVLAAALIEMARAKGKRVIFTVPAIELIDQTVVRFYQDGIRDVGVIQADHPMTDPSKPVQVASIQTLQRRTIPEADMVIIDEAHKVFDFVANWMAKDEWLKVPFIGLSATPWTKGLGRLYDRLIVSTTIGELIEQGYLSPFKVFAPSKPSLKGVRTVAGDYHEQDLSRVMSDKTLVADVVKTWLDKGKGLPTLCFCVDRAHAKTVQARFLEAGVRCGYVDAFTPKPEREQIRKDFATGALEIVCNVGVLVVGVDWDVRCIIIATSTKSEMKYVQLVGRGLRTADGKDTLVLLDHGNTTLNLGFVTDIHHDRLDDGTMGDKADPLGGETKAKPKECPQCHYVRDAKVRACPACGFVASPVSKVETVDGELIDLTAARKKAPEPTMAEKVAFIAQLRAYAILKGKSENWVSGRFRAKFGVWPNDPRVRYAKPAAGVSPEVNSWLVAQNIRYAKSMAKLTRGAA